MTIAEKLTAIAEGEQKVYEAGKAAQEQAFWDIYQNKGARRDYLCAFAGAGWKSDNFAPRYDIVPTGAYMMFRDCLIEGDLVEILANLGVNLNFSQSTSMMYTFQQSAFARVGVIDTTKVNRVDGLFQNASYLLTVDRLAVKDDGTTTFANAFQNCTALENITIKGVIGQNIDVHWSTLLTHDSLMSIINALQDKSADTSGTSWVVTLGTTNLAKLTDEEKAIATERGWTLA